MEIIIGVAFIFFLGWIIPSPLSWAARRKLDDHNRSLREHLHTKMEIDAEGMKQLKDDHNRLKQLNENLRISNQTLRNKPGRAELRLLQVYDRAINIMLAKAPGFAPTWQAVLAHVEKEMKQADQGVTAYVRRVFRPSGQLDCLSPQSIKLLDKQNSEHGVENLEK